MSNKNGWKKMTLWTTGEKMKLDFQAEAMKAVPAVAGAGASKALEVANHFDWSVGAAQATFFYIILQGLYLLWKWYSEAQERKKSWKKRR